MKPPIQFPNTVTLRKTQADSDSGESTYEVRALDGVPIEAVNEALERFDFRVSEGPVAGIQAIAVSPEENERRAREFKEIEARREAQERQRREEDVQLVRAMRADGAVEVEICRNGGFRVRWPEAEESKRPGRKASADSSG